MNAAILVEQNTSLVVSEVEIPKLDVGQVLVKVEYSGVCGKQVGKNIIRAYRRRQVMKVSSKAERQCVK